MIGVSWKDLWGQRLSFVEPGNVIALRVIKFHDYLCFILFFISIFVLCFMVIILLNYAFGHFNSEEQVEARKDIYQQSKITHNPILEFIWTLFPTFLLINMAIPTFFLLYFMDLLIAPKLNIKAIGNQWYWSYETNDFPWNSTKFSFDSYLLQEAQLDFGEKRLLEVDTFLVLPVQTEMRLLVSARDVLHSFALPALSIKIDAIPGRLNCNPLEISVPGTYFGQCSELCGPNHGFMPILIQAQRAQV